MAEIKDKVITAESLLALHEYNKNIYMTQTNPQGKGDMYIDGSGVFTQDLYANGGKVVTSQDVVLVENGGTGCNNGVDALRNLFNCGETILSSHQYGDELPQAGCVGRIFFKRLTD